MNRLGILVVIGVLMLVPPAGAEEEKAKEPSHPLGSWSGLVGGQWHAKGAWSMGMPFEGRIRAEWGPGKRYLRFRILIPKGAADYVRYDSLYWVDPESKEPNYFSTAYTGEAVRGTFEIEGDEVRFLYESAGGMPPIRSVYEFLSEDRCRWTAHARQGEKWAPMIDVVYERGEVEERERIETKPPAPHHLEAFGKHVGGRWRMQVGEGPEGTLDRTMHVEHRWGLTHRVMETRTYAATDGGEKLFSEAFTYWDSNEGGIRSFAFNPGGVVTYAEVRLTEDGSEWTYDNGVRLTMRGGEEGPVEGEFSRPGEDGGRTVLSRFRATRVKEEAAKDGE